VLCFAFQISTGASDDDEIKNGEVQTDLPLLL
jgi:hypothetical protein